MKDNEDGISVQLSTVTNESLSLSKDTTNTQVDDNSGNGSTVKDSENNATSSCLIPNKNSGSSTGSLSKRNGYSDGDGQCPTEIAKKGRQLNQLYKY